MKPNPNLTIFYTDDDLDDLEFFREATEAMGEHIELVTLTSGSALLEILENPPPCPHLIFLDINMPGLTGFDVLEKMRESENELPVIMFTTSSDQVIIDRSFSLGASFFVQKSGDFPTLKKSIEYATKIDWSTYTRTSENFVYAA